MEHSKKGHTLRGKFPQHGLPVPFYFCFIQFPAIGCRADNDWALFQSVDFLNLIGDAVIYHDGKSAAAHKKALLPASFRTILFLPNAAGVKIELMGVVDQLRTAEEKPRDYIRHLKIRKIMAAYDVRVVGMKHSAKPDPFAEDMLPFGENRMFSLQRSHFKRHQFNTGKLGFRYVVRFIINRHDPVARFPRRCHLPLIPAGG